MKLYRDAQPMFTRYGIESQLDAMFSPIVQLRSGGYIVINQAEALVAIDVNSGRATREHHIEDTALKTKCEAAEEIARQLRLRDLAGLIVIDFIDMDEGRNNRTVERRLKEALGTTAPASRSATSRISACWKCRASASAPRCWKARPRNARSAAAPVTCARSPRWRCSCCARIEEMLIKGATHNLIVRTRSEVALYVLNHKRAHLRALEERFRITITISADPTVNGQQSYIIDRGEQVHTADAARAIAAAQPELAAPIEEQDDDIADEEETGRGSLRPRPAANTKHRRGRRGGGRAAADQRRSVTRTAATATAALAGVAGVAAAAGVEAANRARRVLRMTPCLMPQTLRKVSRKPMTAITMAAPKTAPPPKRTDRAHRLAKSAAMVFAAAAADAAADAATGMAATAMRRRAGIDGPINEAPAPEPGLRHAVEDLDRPPAPYADERPPTEQLSPAFEPPPAPPAAAASETEAPRRRSTIREVLRYASPPAGAPAPAPVISSTGSEETATPKRGWWATAAARRQELASQGDRRAVS